MSYVQFWLLANYKNIVSLFCSYGIKENIYNISNHTGRIDLRLWLRASASIAVAN